MRLQDRSILVRLRIESWGTTRQDDAANKAVAEAKNSSERATRVSKRLAPEDTLKGVKSRSEEARTHLREQTTPWTDDGARLLDASQLFKLQDRLTATFRPKWQEEVDKVLLKLDYFRDVWGPANLGDLYDPDLYPSEREMRRAFRWNLDVLPLNPDSKELRVILGNEYVDGIQRAAELAMQEDLVKRITAPIQNMVRRLREPDGKFKDSLVENVRDIASLIPALNITADPRLAALQEDIETQLIAYSPYTLRASRSARQETAAAAESILSKLQSHGIGDEWGDGYASEPKAEPEPHLLSPISQLPTPTEQMAALQIAVTPSPISQLPSPILDAPILDTTTAAMMKHLLGSQPSFL